MRIFWVFSTFVFGVIATVLGFIWVQGNMALPGELHRYFWEKLSWPWLPFEESSVVVRAIVDESLVCFFFLSIYFLHRQNSLLSRVIPAKIRRSTELCLTGILFFTLIGCWQHTGIIVWDLFPYFRSTLRIVLAVVYGLLVAFALLQLPTPRSASQPASTIRNWAIALGLEQLYCTSEEARALNAPLKMQRISLSLVAGAMLVGTPMSLDRLLFALPLVLLAAKCQPKSS